MNAWSAIQYVGSGLSLVAFVVAVALFAYRRRLQHRAEIIRSAPRDERLAAIATTAEFFRVDVSDLSEERRQEIVLAQINLRARRDLLLTGLIFVVAVLMAAVAFVTIVASRFPPGTGSLDPSHAADVLQRQVRSKDVTVRGLELAPHFSMPLRARI